MLKIIEFQPEGRGNQDSVVLVPGHLGSSTVDDFGHKADMMAGFLNTPFVVWDRPGNATNQHLVDKPLSVRAYHELMADVCGDLSELVARRGVSRVIVSGNSAGATDAICIALGVEGVTHAAIADPVGMRARPDRRQRNTWLRYQAAEAIRERTGKSVNHYPGPDIPVLTLWSRVRHDTNLYRGVWQTPIALLGLRDLAATPHIATNVEFAGKTFTARVGQLHRIAADLTAIRAESARLHPDSAQPLTARVALRDAHSKYNDPAVHAALIAEVIRQTDG